MAEWSKKKKKPKAPSVSLRDDLVAITAQTLNQEIQLKQPIYILSILLESDDSSGYPVLGMDISFFLLPFFFQFSVFPFY